ncbi:AraC family transcriptional regulator [Luteimonas sp. SJ-92]|uniref:AraC family transcriptional regulator n=1 Tax=Luteimonas salinisoli TaxID=2752307 RepID=A0A853JCB0_9GAMM|nr:AraC family transcriptional regulator [Luteimonas salinisoli]NZA26230.1 AraC family transcriptional regulator [Luteimonas salinisoli]
MADPLSQLVGLLRPRAAFANVISGKGRWAVRYAEYGRPSFCIVLAGGCRLAVDGHAPLAVGAGDFILLPTTPAFTLSSDDPPAPVPWDADTLPRDGSEVRYGDPGGVPDMRSLGGAFLFDSADPALLVSLLPPVVHVRGAARLSQLVAMVAEETTQPRPGSESALSRLVELLLIEAMRATTAGDAPPGLLRGLGDERLAAALTRMHAHIDWPWTVAQLASTAALSRSSFFERFTRTVGVAPMEYLLAWRMQIARQLLRQGELRASEIAERVGYGSSSAFSVAFRRHVGMAPSRYASSRTEAVETSVPTASGT